MVELHFDWFSLLYCFVLVDLVLLSLIWLILFLFLGGKVWFGLLKFGFVNQFVWIVWIDQKRERVVAKSKIFMSSDKEDVCEGKQGRRREADQGAVAGRAHQVRLHHFHVRQSSNITNNCSTRANMSSHLGGEGCAQAFWRP